MTSLLSAPTLPIALSTNPHDYSKFERRSLLPHDPDFLWQIESGVVRTLSWFEDGSVSTLGLWGAGDVVGSSLSTVNPYEIECLTQVKAKVLPRRDWHQVMDALVLHIQRSEEFLKIVHCKQTEASLFHLLSWLAKRFGREVEEGLLIDMRLTHQDIAELIGTTRVTVTRMLGNFKKQGIILSNQRLTIILPDQLPFWHYEI